MNPTRAGGACPSEFALESLRLSEAAGSKARRAIGDHVDHCAACTDRLAALSAAPPPFPLDAVWREVREASGREERRPGARPARRAYRAWLIRGVAVVGTATLTLVAAGRLVPRVQPPADLVKGGPWGLTVIAQRHGWHEVTRLASGARLSQGDRLRFEVSTSWTHGYAGVISLDSRGVVSILAPTDGQTAEVRGSQRLLLDGAVELDESIGSERIDLIGCRRPMPVTALADAARTALRGQHGDLRKVGQIAPGCHQETFWFDKVAR
jgi:hypothetical protein